MALAEKGKKSSGGLAMPAASLVLKTTPSASNYKSFQEFWRVKPSQSLAKIIERNTKIYDIK